MTRWLLDTSALAQRSDAGVGVRLARQAAIVATGDVVIAACAQVNGLVVVHYDADYQTIGDACGRSLSPSDRGVSASTSKRTRG